MFRPRRIPTPQWFTPPSGLIRAGTLAITLTGCAGGSPPGSAPSPAAASPATQLARRPPTEADVRFMTGMIHHHAQALLIAGWAPGHGASQAVRILCERIIVAQQDEIDLMGRFLREWGQPVPDADPAHATMPGMHHPMMPGMLNAEQLAQLDAARGTEFDRLFLTFMIQHHQGALTMVQQLLAEPGAARDDNVFKLVSDMNADQTTEIDRMYTMLAQLVTAGHEP
jgi:uncharacterized protein (DUF305 family)